MIYQHLWICSINGRKSATSIRDCCALSIQLFLQTCNPISFFKLRTAILLPRSLTSSFCFYFLSHFISLLSGLFNHPFFLDESLHFWLTQVELLISFSSIPMALWGGTISNNHPPSHPCYREITQKLNSAKWIAPQSTIIEVYPMIC